MWQGECRKGLSALVVDMNLQRPLRVDDLLIDARKSKGNPVRRMDGVEQSLIAGSQPVLQAL